MSIDLFREVSLKYYDSLEKGNPEFPFEILNFTFQTDAKDIIWGTYEEDFTRAIINLFNKFATCLYRVYILEKIISQYDVKYLLALRSEFIHIPLHYCLHKPYEFVGRVQYSCIYLCNQANQSVLKLSNQIDSSEDNKYDFKLLKQISKKWSSREQLLQAINSVGNWNQEFRANTSDYRNRALFDLLHQAGLAQYILRGGAVFQ